MAARDNTKSFTPALHACTGGRSGVLKSMARPGSRNNNKPAGAGSVESVNGKTPRPGWHQNKPAGGGYGSVARPGRNQKIKG